MHISISPRHQGRGDGVPVPEKQNWASAACIPVSCESLIDTSPEEVAILYCSPGGIPAVAVPENR